MKETNKNKDTNNISNSSNNNKTQNKERGTPFPLIKKAF